MESLQGQLLIASPRLVDPNFARSVVVMVQHNDDGALGLILNRPLQTTIKEVCDRRADRLQNRVRVHLDAHAFVARGKVRTGDPADDFAVAQERGLDGGRADVDGKKVHGENPKSEARNPKQIQRTKSPNDLNG